VPDFSKPFYIACDASNAGIGAVLLQLEDDSKARPDLSPDPRNHRFIAMASRGLQKSERNYSATKKEALALVFALIKFRHYVLGKRTVVYTDHRALVWLFDQYESNKLTNTWLDTYMEYDIQIVHLPGIKNVLPDHLSRIYSALGGVTGEARSSIFDPSSSAEPLSKQQNAGATKPVSPDPLAHSRRKPQAARSRRSRSPAERSATVIIAAQSTKTDEGAQQLPRYNQAAKQSWIKAIKKAKHIDCTIHLPQRGTAMPTQEWGRATFVDCTENPLLIKKTLTKAIAEAVNNEATSVLLVPAWADAEWYSWVVHGLTVQPVASRDEELMLVTVDNQNAVAISNSSFNPKFNRATLIADPVSCEVVEDPRSRPFRRRRR
jgi:hypothetical protein